MTIITEALYELMDWTDESFEETPASTIIGGTIATATIAYFTVKIQAPTISIMTNLMS